MQQIILQNAPSQTIRAVLGNQNCQLFLYQKTEGLFVDVAVENNTIVAAALALELVPIVCRTYAGFVGNLIFVDTQGNSDPHYSQFNSRYSLVYLNEAEYDLFQQ